jgi:hypothetical protein
VVVGGPWSPVESSPAPGTSLHTDCPNPGTRSPDGRQTDRGGAERKFGATRSVAAALRGQSSSLRSGGMEIDASASSPGGPTSGMAMSPEYVAAIARVAYVWGWPMVNQLNRREALTAVDEPGLRGGVLPNAPVGTVCMMTDYIAPDQRFIACTNQDVAYGMGYGRLEVEPSVIQVPVREMRCVPSTTRRFRSPSRQRRPPRRRPRPPHPRRLRHQSGAPSS